MANRKTPNRHFTIRKASGLGANQAVESYAGLPW
jgi:hypothetical protein